jgi:hypothetical protein
MLRAAHQRGVQTALADFGVKEAFDIKSLLMGAKNVAIGSPIETGRQLLKGKAFAPGGLLNLRENFWPAMPKTGPWYHKVGPLAQRAFMTGLPAYGVIQAARGKSGDPNEGRLSNVLGALGSAAGFGLGFPAVGMLGSSYVASAGQHLGQGLGHLLGSRPSPSTENASPMYPSMGTVFQ